MQSEGTAFRAEALDAHLILPCRERPPLLPFARRVAAGQSICFTAWGRTALTPISAACWMLGRPATEATAPRRSPCVRIAAARRWLPANPSPLSPPVSHLLPPLPDLDGSRYRIPGTWQGGPPVKTGGLSSVHPHLSLPGALPPPNHDSAAHRGSAAVTARGASQPQQLARSGRPPPGASARHNPPPPIHPHSHHIHPHSTRRRGALAVRKNDRMATTAAAALVWRRRDRADATQVAAAAGVTRCHQGCGKS